MIRKKNIFFGAFKKIFFPVRMNHKKSSLTSIEKQQMRDIGLEAVKEWQEWQSTDRFQSVKIKNLTAFYFALDNSYLDIVKFLIEIGTPFDDGAMRIACSKENLPIVELLVSNGASIHFDDNLPVRLASLHGHLDIVKFLVSKGADIHVLEDYALRASCKNGHFDVVKFLVSCGADIHATDDSAVIQACKNGHYEIFEYLVSLGANVRTCSEQALGEACSGGHLKIVKRLVSLGADIHACHDFAFKMATACNHVEIQKYLISIGADVRSNNDYAIRMADYRCQWEMMKYLISLGCPETLVKKNKKGYAQYLSFFEKMREKARTRAQKKIYFWIIPKLYSPSSESAYRLGLKGYEASMQGRLM